jgi:hypothetical protein
VTTWTKNGGTRFCQCNVLWGKAGVHLKSRIMMTIITISLYKSQTVIIPYLMLQIWEATSVTIPLWWCKKIEILLKPSNSCNSHPNLKKKRWGLSLSTLTPWRGNSLNSITECAGCHRLQSTGRYSGMMIGTRSVINHSQWLKNKIWYLCNWLS